MVVDADEGASEGEYLAEGNEDGMVDFAQRRAAEARDKQCAPESAHCSSDDELKAFHLIKNFELRIKLNCSSPRRLLPIRTYARCCVRFGS